VLDSTTCPTPLLTSSIFSLGDCFLFSPSNPIKKFFYRCDRRFHLDDLIKLYEDCDNYAIVLISGKRVEYYLHSANQTRLLKSLDENLPNQHKTGGQSAQRFERIRDEKIGWYTKKITEIMVQYYVKEGKFLYKGLIIAGPAEMKDWVKEEELFTRFFDKHLLKTLKISEINSQSIYQVINSAADILTSQKSEKELVSLFEEMLSDPKMIDLFVFGVQEVERAFNEGELKEIYVSNKYTNIDKLLQSNTKTKINIIKSNDFHGKYDELVGIRYYAQFALDEIPEEINDGIVEV